MGKTTIGEVERMIPKLVKTAESYIGVKQGDKRHKDLVQKYNAVKPLPVGYPLKETDDWCAAFVTVIGDITGASKYIGRECGVHRFAQIFRKKGIWIGLEKPRTGDIVIFDWHKNAWMDHIGIVEKLSGSKVTVIEGNTSKRVARRVYNWNDWRVAGYARPNYPTIGKKPSKSIEDLAREVIAGKWGNGSERNEKLKKAGYDAVLVQKEVNRQLSHSKAPFKSNQTIAREVLKGKWSNGSKRKESLEKAGYDYQAIQKIVNQLL